MTKQNCWEFKKCGRERKSEKGICPAVMEARTDGVNEGKNAGRVCWAVEGTFCDGEVQRTYAQKLPACYACDFRSKVQEEMGLSFRFIHI